MHPLITRYLRTWRVQVPFRETAYDAIKCRLQMIVSASIPGERLYPYYRYSVIEPQQPGIFQKILGTQAFALDYNSFRLTTKFFTGLSNRMKNIIFAPLIAKAI
jgi:hypothetical protein